MFAVICAFHYPPVSNPYNLFFQENFYQKPQFQKFLTLKPFEAQTPGTTTTHFQQNPKILLRFKRTKNLVAPSQTHIERLITANDSLPHRFIQPPCLHNPINNFIEFYKLVAIQIIDPYFDII
jgi:hypothetical protein